MVAVLQQVGGSRVIAIDRAVILVGRGADCDVVITTSQKISRHHCCVVQVDNSYYLRDLGSMNGVWLNGGRVNREARMASGDKVAIGDTEFLFHPNARIEQKKATSPPANRPAAPTQTGNVAAPAAPPPVTMKPAEIVKSPQKDLIVDLDEFEIIDDVIPLSETGLARVDTNEVEIIDEPIVDLDGNPDSNDDSILSDLMLQDIIQAGDSDLLTIQQRLSIGASDRPAPVACAISDVINDGGKLFTATFDQLAVERFDRVHLGFDVVRDVDYNRSCGMNSEVNAEVVQQGLRPEWF